MRNYHFDNVSHALFVLMKGIEQSGLYVETRNGPAYEFDSPVAVTYMNPRHKVLFYPERDANPFFHCLESLWMLAGRNDTQFVEQYSKNIGRYSDDGQTFNGAYGHRWRQHFDYDQLLLAAYRLKKYPNDRRTVVSMWDGTYDLMKENDIKDVPCNTHIYFSVRNEHLNMTVCNRSNDLIWGMCGANAVHMSFLLEYMAARVGVRVGEYVQFTNNLHAYKDVLYKHKISQPEVSPYLGMEPPLPLVLNAEVFDYEVKAFCGDTKTSYTEPFIATVAVPMANAYAAYRKGDYDEAYNHAQNIRSADWRKSCTEWLGRRRAKHDD
jgi:thymidylate synthase